MSTEERAWVERRASAPLDPTAKYSLSDLIPPLFFAGCLAIVLSVPLALVARIRRLVPANFVVWSLVCGYAVMVAFWLQRKWSRRRRHKRERERLARDLEGGKVEVARFRPTEVVASCVTESQGQAHRWESGGAFVFRLGDSAALALSELDCDGATGWPNTEFDVIRLPHSSRVLRVVGYGQFLEPTLKTDEWILDHSITEGEVFEADWASFFRSRTGTLRRSG